MALKTLGMNTCVQAEKRVMLGYYNIHGEEHKKEKVDRMREKLGECSIVRNKWRNYLKGWVMTTNCSIKHNVGQWPLDSRAVTMTKAVWEELR